MKNLSITIIGISFGLLLMWSQAFPQEQIKSEPTDTKGSISGEQSWSLELRAKRTYNVQSTINNFFLVNPSNVWCKFAIAYDHGGNYWTPGNRMYRFTYFLFKNGVEIDSYSDDVQDEDVNEYIAYHEFTTSVQIFSDNVVTGALKILYAESPTGGGTIWTPLLPPTASPPYQLAPNSIALSINQSNVTIGTIVQPMCPTIATPNYYHRVEATNSITLNPGFMIDADNMDFYAEAINGFGGTKNVENMPDMSEEIVLKNGIEQNADEVFIWIYPNPSNGKFTVKNIRTEEITVSFYGQMGKLIPDEKLKAGEEKAVNLTQINAHFITLLINSNGKFVSRNTMIINK